MRNVSFFLIFCWNWIWLGMSTVCKQLADLLSCLLEVFSKERMFWNKMKIWKIIIFSWAIKISIISYSVLFPSHCCHSDSLAFQSWCRADKVARLMEMYLCCHAEGGSQDSRVVRCFMHEKHLLEKSGISCFVQHRVPAVLLPWPFLNFLHSVFVMAGCLFGLVGRMGDIGKFS